MIVVADASPLIFLAKLRRLDLMGGDRGSAIHASALVHAEVLSPSVANGERQALETFFCGGQIHPPQKARLFATALSPADNDTLALAIRLRAARLLADDRILRAMAAAQGIRPMGTLGLLLAALRQGALSPQKTRRLLDALVRLHGFRIGIEVYQAALAQIDRF